MIPSPWHKGAFSTLSNAELWLNAVSQDIISWLEEQGLSSIPPLAAHPHCKMRLSHPLLLALQIPLQWTADGIWELPTSEQVLGLRCASDLCALTLRARAAAPRLSVTDSCKELCSPWCSSHTLVTAARPEVHYWNWNSLHSLSLISGTNMEKEIKIIEEEVSHVVCYQPQLTVTPSLKLFCLMTSKAFIFIWWQGIGAFSILFSSRIEY